MLNPLRKMSTLWNIFQ
ncbi:hypothetical protein F383_28531 [Gossypium arboreum]|uniref:Uncharacterized protein n=1 Tax=Gossypium arboreum TaxID=29729 RepID=A0A0B0PB26_GOSAR|nr:hypothetical protein F383_28531 [Gossypium arboreum]